jgi:hypothetical protein
MTFFHRLDHILITTLYSHCSVQTKTAVAVLKEKGKTRGRKRGPECKGLSDRYHVGGWPVMYNTREEEKEEEKPKLLRQIVFVSRRL